MVMDKTNNKPRGYAFIEYVHTRDMKGFSKLLFFCLFEVSLPSLILLDIIQLRINKLMERRLIIEECWLM